MPREFDILARLEKTDARDAPEPLYQRVGGHRHRARQAPGRAQDQAHRRKAAAEVFTNLPVLSGQRRDVAWRSHALEWCRWELAREGSTEQVRCSIARRRADPQSRTL